MDRGSRLKAMWHGDVPDADLQAMFAATESVTRLRQGLEDQRLAAKLDADGAEWRAALAVGQIAGPLWLADALIVLAGRFYDDEKQARTEHVGLVSAYVHDLVSALLAPVEAIGADVAAALVDPNHRTALTAPLHIGPEGQIAQGGLPEPISMQFARSLAQAARQIHTSAAVTLAATQHDAGIAPAPEWLTVGLRRLAGELEATGVRLDMAELKRTALTMPGGAHGGGDPVALTALCRDLWAIVDAALVVGQEAADPHLLREAPRAPADAQVPGVSVGPREPLEQRPARLPRIAEGIPAPVRREDAGAGQRTGIGQGSSVATPLPVSLPRVGEASGRGAAGGATPEAAHPERASVVDVSFPSIGQETSTHEADASQHGKTGAGDQSIGGGKNAGDDGTHTLRFPDIG